jgi:16S rRNA G1207 methylase RsmC
VEWLTTCAILLIPAYMAALAYTQQNLTERITTMSDSTQQSIDAVVAQLTKSHQELSAELAKATADINDQIAAAGVEVDLSALTSIAQQLDDLVPDVAVTPEVEAPVEVDTLEAELEGELDDELEEPVTEEAVDPVATDKVADKKFRP